MEVRGSLAGEGGCEMYPGDGGVRGLPAWAACWDWDCHLALGPISRLRMVQTMPLQPLLLPVAG